jgi:hypothetical protein
MKLNTDRVALIAGSTGIVGRNLAALLLEQGWNVTAQMFLQTSGDVAVLGECRLIESFRFSGPFPMRHDCRQKLKVADMRS